MSFSFSKVEGLGNDFILIEGLGAGPAPTLEPSQVAAVCDRHRGIGADGLLWLGPSPRADARLEIWNADGSRSEMCGNGLRCAAQQLFPKLGRREILIETAAGLHHCRPADGPAADDVWVELLGLTVAAPEILEVSGRRIAGRVVRLGNPHFVTRDAPLDATGILGPALERHPRFAPQRTNVELCALSDGKLRVRVWERGAGLTLACGTGAGAAAAAAWADGALPRATTVVELPGGSVSVEPLADDRLGLSGPAREVFRGQIDL